MKKNVEKEADSLKKRLQREYGIEDEGGKALLDLMRAAFIRMRKAQEIVDRDGIVIADRWGQSKPNPACAVERDARAQVLQAIRQLNLDLEPLQERVGRPGGR